VTQTLPCKSALVALARSEWRAERLRRVIWVGALAVLGLLYAGWGMAAVRFWVLERPGVTVLNGPGSHLWQALGNPGHWSLLCMALVPILASAAVVLSTSVAISSARQDSSLDVLRLAPFEAGSLASAFLRPRLRTGLLILLAGAPFYFAPHDFSLTGELFEPWFVSHTLLSSTLGRGLILIGPLTAHGWPEHVDPERLSFLADNLFSGTLALAIDASRLFAVAAIGTAAALRTRTAARAVVWAAGFAALFLLVTAAGEAAGALLVRGTMPAHPFERCKDLVLAALALEVGVGNLLVPWLVLGSAARRAEDLLARAEEG